MRARYLAIAALLFSTLPCLGGVASPTPSSSASPAPMTSPAVPSEAEILWERSQEQLQGRQVEEAILTLRRLVDRIPTHSRSIQAQALLGQLELERGRADEALEWFKIAQNNLRGQGSGARELDLLRARAYLLLGKHSEALLAAEKLLRDADTGKIRWGVDAQVIKTRALLLLKQSKRAESSLAAARRRKLADSLHPPTATLWLEVADLQFTESKCARYPSASRLAEEQVIDQMGRHADCVLQARTQYDKILALPEPTSIDGKQARTDAEASWGRIRRRFEDNCENPPLPLEKRTKQELEAYRSELKLALQPACSKVKYP
jgi:tetratricopeptide (TPR) repeat protein